MVLFCAVVLKYRLYLLGVPPPSQISLTSYNNLLDFLFSGIFFRLLPLSLRHFRRMSPSILIRTRAVSDVEVAGSRVKTSVSLRRVTCRGGHVEAVFFSPIFRPPFSGIGAPYCLLLYYESTSLGSAGGKSKMCSSI